MKLCSNEFKFARLLMRDIDLESTKIPDLICQRYNFQGRNSVTLEINIS